MVGAIPELGVARLEAHQFQTKLGLHVRPCLKNQPTGLCQMAQRIWVFEILGTYMMGVENQLLSAVL